jgi:hypothetical protein
VSAYKKSNCASIIEMARRHTRRGKGGLLKPVKEGVRMTSMAVKKTVGAVDKLVRGSLSMVGRTGAAVARTASKAVNRITRRKGSRRGTRRHRR